ncbi:MAG: hypothetical protein IT361_06060 [Gemmatimonadaceae bacterium]|nr:hypothetical protein [Gemmatimonadaceae bacterium]
MAAPLAVVAIAASAWASLPADEPPSVRSPVPEIHLAAPMVAESIAAAAEVVERRNPFSISRRPVTTSQRVEPAAARPQPPLLQLQGIVGGPPWSAVVQGIPGRDGEVLVQPGDTIAGLRIVRVTSTSVLVAMRDTAWALRLAGDER